MSSIHNPTNFNPADYVFVDYFDNQPPKADNWGNWTKEGAAMFTAMRDAWTAEKAALFPEDNCYRCEHCGNGRVRWVVCAEHKPTGKRVCFGAACQERLNFATREQYKLKRLQERAEASARALALRGQIEASLKLHPELARILAAAKTSSNSFVRDLAYKFEKYGSLSEAQRTAGIAAIERDEQRAADRAKTEPQPTAPAPVGRQEVSGVVLGIKTVEHDVYGTSYKMLVRLDDTNAKVYCTVPAPLLLASGVYCRPEADTHGPKGFVACPSRNVHGDVVRGSHIKFKATFERSDRDQFFAFGSRPKLTGFLD